MDRSGHLRWGRPAPKEVADPLKEAGLLVHAIYHLLRPSARRSGSTAKRGQSIDVINCAGATAFCGRAIPSRNATRSRHKKRQAVAEESFAGA
jgi:hypothetical protein